MRTLLASSFALVLSRSEGLDGEITITATELPIGVSAAPLVIPAG